MPSSSMVWWSPKCTVSSTPTAPRVATCANTPAAFHARCGLSWSSGRTSFTDSGTVARCPAAGLSVRHCLAPRLRSAAETRRAVLSPPLSRLSMLALAYQGTYTADVRDLIADLQALSIHDFEKVRFRPP